MHIYEKNGNHYYSVTTILSILGSKTLMKWANSLGFKHIDSEKYTEDKATFGTLVHASLQKTVDPNADVEHIEPKNDLHAFECNQCIDSFNRELKNHTYKTLYTEKTLISEDLAYAGTLDWLVELDGKITLTDFKTSKQVTFKHFLQLSAYAQLLMVEEGIMVDQAALILVNTDKTTIVYFPKELLYVGYELFSRLTDFYMYEKDVKVILSKYVTENTLPHTVLS